MLQSVTTVGTLLTSFVPPNSLILLPLETQQGGTTWYRLRGASLGAPSSDHPAGEAQDQASSCDVSRGWEELSSVSL